MLESNQGTIKSIALDDVDASVLYKSINLLEEHVDYKKMPLSKLRQIVSDKGLASDVSKLKKNELLKLIE